MFRDAEPSQIPCIEPLTGLLGSMKASEIDRSVLGIDDDGTTWSLRTLPAIALFGVNKDTVRHCSRYNQPIEDLSTACKETYT